MNRTIVVISLFSMFYTSAFAQEGRKLNDGEKAVFEQKMMEQSQKIKTLQCDFVQEKSSTLVMEKAVAKGILCYQSPSMLRWEYRTPTPSTLILNGQNAVLLDKDGKRAGNEKAVKPLGNIIISMINGDGIKNNKQFSTEIFESNNHFLITLTPVQKRLKEFYKSIALKVDKNTFLAFEILMNERSGDMIVIYLSNKKLNEKIGDKEFKIK